MQTRRDQLQAYRYLLRRVLASMLGSEPEAVEQPMRRVTSSTFAGIMVGVVACAGVALYGWLADTSATSWKQQSGALIIEKETNAAYLYLPKDALANAGKPAEAQAPQAQPPAAQGQVDEKNMMLVQVLNHTSARLILDAEPRIVRVSQRSLDGIPRGPRIGIPLAPSALPSKDNVVSSPWTICSTSRTVDDAQTLEVDLLVGRNEKALGAQPVAADRGLLVSAGEQEPTYLVWKGKRLRVDATALRSLELSSSAALPVGAAWLDALEAGQPLEAPVISGRFSQSRFTVGGEPAWVGQVFHTPSPDSFYVMLQDGFSRISDVQANLLFGAGTARIGDQIQSQATEVAIGAVTQASSATPDLLVPDLPESTPDLVDVSSASGAPVCLWYADGQEGLRLTSGGKLPPPTEAPAAESGDAGNGGSGGGLADNFADRVLVPPGRVAVVGLRPAPGVKADSFYLLTEDGVKFPVPNAEVLGKLGYAGVDPVQVPSALLRLVPQGPALTVEAAYQAATFETPASEPAPAGAGE